MAKKEYLRFDPTDRWYARPEDTIGGWCIVNHPTLTPATMDHRKGDPSGHVMRNIQVVADFMFEDAAKHIAKLHNDWLENPQI